MKSNSPVINQKQAGSSNSGNSSGNSGSSAGRPVVPPPSSSSIISPSFSVDSYYQPNCQTPNHLSIFRSPPYVTPEQRAAMPASSSPDSSPVAILQQQSAEVAGIPPTAAIANPVINITTTTTTTTTTAQPATAPLSTPAAYPKEVYESSPAVGGSGCDNSKSQCDVCMKGSPSCLNSKSSWATILWVVFFSLKEKSRGQEFFSLKRDVYPFVSHHWDVLCPKRSRSHKWKKQIQDALSHSKVFKSGIQKLGCNGYWKLKSYTSPWTTLKPADLDEFQPSTDDEDCPSSNSKRSRDDDDDDDQKKRVRGESPRDNQPLSPNAFPQKYISAPSSSSYKSSQRIQLQNGGVETLQKDQQSSINSVWDAVIGLTKRLDSFEQALSEHRNVTNAKLGDIYNCLNTLVSNLPHQQESHHFRHQQLQSNSPIHSPESPIESSSPPHHSFRSQSSQQQQQTKFNQPKFYAPYSQFQQPSSQQYQIRPKPSFTKPASLSRVDNSKADQVSLGDWLHPVNTLTSPDIPNLTTKHYNPQRLPSHDYSTQQQQQLHQQQQQPKQIPQNFQTHHNPKYQKQSSHHISQNELVKLQQRTKFNIQTPNNDIPSSETRQIQYILNS